MSLEWYKQWICVRLAYSWEESIAKSSDHLVESQGSPALTIYFHVNLTWEIKAVGLTAVTVQYYNYNNL